MYIVDVQRGQAFPRSKFFVPVCICVMFRRTRAQPGRGGGSGSLWVKPCGAVSCCFGASSQLLTGHQLVLQSYYMDLLKLFYGFAKVTKWICKTFLALSCCCFGASSQLLRVASASVSKKLHVFFKVVACICSRQLLLWS